MESLGDVSHSVTVFGEWIFLFKIKKVLPLTMGSLNIICYCSEKEKIVTFFDTGFNAVRYVNPKSKQRCVQNRINIFIKICNLEY